MEMDQRVDDLILICNKMSSLLALENSALNEKKYDQIEAILSEKLSLGHAYARRMDGLMKDEANLKKVDPKTIGNLMDLGKTLNEQMEINTTLLTGSIEANRTILDVIAKAVQEQGKDDAGTYLKNGKEGRSDNLSASVGTPISIDQNL